MKVLVCGGREYFDQVYMFEVLTALHAKHGFTVVIEGGQEGADRIAFQWATSHGVGSHTFKANWDLGRKAGPIRNRQMLIEGEPGMVVAFPGGKGTADCVRGARARGIYTLCYDGKSMTPWEWNRG